MFSKKLNYKSLPNIRDLGGMRTVDGRQIIAGKLIRSGHLSGMPEEEVSDLAGLVGAVIDFRSDSERQENPDAQLADAEYYHIPVVQSLTPGVSREEESDRRAISQLLFTPEEAKRYMIEMYRSLVSDYAVAQYAEFVRILQKGHEKATLWHCTAGMRPVKADGQIDQQNARLQGCFEIGILKSPHRELIPEAAIFISAFNRCFGNINHKRISERSNTI